MELDGGDLNVPVNKTDRRNLACFLFGIFCPNFLQLISLAAFQDFSDKCCCMGNNYYGSGFSGSSGSGLFLDLINPIHFLSSSMLVMTTCLNIGCGCKTNSVGHGRVQDSDADPGFSYMVGSGAGPRLDLIRQRCLFLVHKTALKIAIRLPPAYQQKVTP